MCNEGVSTSRNPSLAWLCALAGLLLAGCGTYPCAHRHTEPAHTIAHVICAPRCNLSDLPVIKAENADQLVQLDVLRRHTQGTFEVIFSPDNRTPASSSFDGTLRLWDVASGAEVSAASHGPQATGLAFSPAILGERRSMRPGN